MPAYSTAMSTWPGLRVGSGTSRITTASGPFNSVTTAARTTTLLVSSTCQTKVVRNVASPVPSPSYVVPGVPPTGTSSIPLKMHVLLVAPRAQSEIFLWHLGTFNQSRRRGCWALPLDGCLYGLVDDVAQCLGELSSPSPSPSPAAMTCWSARP